MARGCPLCNYKRTSLIKEIDMCLDSKYLPNHYDLVVCDACGFIYADTSATATDYNQYYEHENKYSHTLTILHETEEYFKYIANIIEQFPCNNPNILDMGCANGCLMELLAAKGYDHVSGIDPSAECVKIIKEKGFRGTVGSIYDKPGNGYADEFDIIILSGVLEHLYDIKSALCNMAAYLKKDGWLITIVPDAANYVNHKNPVPYYFNHEHINHFSSLTLTNCLQICGFERIEVNQCNFRFGSINSPAMIGVFKQRPTKNDFKNDEVTINSVKTYFQNIMEFEQSVIQKIEMMKKSQEPIVIWGTGSYTMNLFSNTVIDECNIYGFIDNDTSKKGEGFLGRVVFSPDYLKAFHGKIVICSMLYQRDIVKQIDAMGIINEIAILA